MTFDSALIKYRRFINAQTDDYDRKKLIQTLIWAKILARKAEAESKLWPYRADSMLKWINLLSRYALIFLGDLLADDLTAGELISVFSISRQDAKQLGNMEDWYCPIRLLQIPSASQEPLVRHMLDILYSTKYHEYSTCAGDVKLAI